MTDRICVGAITGSFGVKGEARVKSFCAEPAAIGDYGPLTTRDGQTSYSLTITRPVKGGFAVRLSGVKTKEQADALRGTTLHAPREALPSRRSRPAGKNWARFMPSTTMAAVTCWSCARRAGPAPRWCPSRKPSCRPSTSPRAAS